MLAHMMTTTVSGESFPVLRNLWWMGADSSHGAEACDAVPTSESSRTVHLAGRRSRARPKVSRTDGPLSVHCMSAERAVPEIFF